MKKEKTFFRTKFSQEAIQEACHKLIEHLSSEDKKSLYQHMYVRLGDENWDHDEESEFFADYKKIIESATFRKEFLNHKFEIQVYFTTSCSRIAVSSPSRAIIESIHQIFEKWAPSCALPDDPVSNEKSPVVFIGHGRNVQWRDLKDHLHELHGYQVDAYEVGARSGHAIRDILEEMLSKSSFAILVLTGEDKDADGKLHARENVIHELGLFQGKLGFPRAIILLEEGTSEFSNIHGIHQIRYSKGNIKETFGDILATLRREFEQEES